MHSTKRFALVGLISTFAFLSLYQAFSSSSHPKNPKNHAVPYDNPSSSVLLSDKIDWSRYAYVQYATNLPYLCNSLMLFERLSHFSSRASRLLLYPSDFSPSSTTPEGQLLQKARDEYNAILQPIEIQHHSSSGDKTWSDSHTKLLAYNQTQCTRLLHLDSDSTLLAHLDELFLLPSAPAAMPRSYWEPQSPLKLSSQLLLLEPSAHEFARMQNAIADAGPSDYDMEILNNLYRDTALVLPHKIYDLYTREFTPHRDTGPKHEKYLGDEDAVWDPDVALRTAKFVHFSDWPLPKPWIKADDKLVEEVAPKCGFGDGGGNGTDGARDCRERDIWLGFYGDFKKRRKEVCGLDLS
ncbi:hypothetical protein ACLMJK_006589 [Lecanora helva]